MSGAWPPASIRGRLTELRDTREALRNFEDAESYYVQQCLARYLAVRAAGYIEAVRDDAADLFTQTRTSREIAQRVQLHLRSGEGVRPTQLEKFMESFSPDWAVELKEMLDANDEALRSSLGALVKARKLIAHGDGETITPNRALGWSHTAEDVGGWVVARFNPRLNTSERVTNH